MRGKRSARLVQFACVWLSLIALSGPATADVWLLGGFLDGEGSIFAAATSNRSGFGVGGVFNGDDSERGAGPSNPTLVHR